MEEAQAFIIEALTGLSLDGNPTPRVRRGRESSAITSASKADNVVFNQLGMTEKVGGAAKLANDLFTGIDTDVQFTGVGLDDMSSGGDSTKTAIANMQVEIDGVGAPNTFKWSNDGGSTHEATTVNITGAAQPLEDGITITFAATGGHTSGDLWDFNAGPQDILGMASTKLGGTNYIVACSAVEAKSLSLSGTTWSSTEISGDWQPACTIDRRWQYATLKDLLIMTDYGQSVMYKWSGTGDVAVLDVSGTGITTLKARYIATVGEFLMAAWTSEDGTTYRNHIWWCDGGLPESWTSTNFENIGGDDGDEITGIIGLQDIVLVFKHNSIWVGAFRGAVDGFVFDKVVLGKGSIAPFAIQSVGSLVYFWFYDGIYVYNGTPTPIRVSDPHVSSLVSENLTEDQAQQIWAIKHPKKDRIFYFSQNVPDSGFPTIIYDLKTKDWSQAEFVFGAAADVRITTDLTYADVDETYESGDGPYETLYSTTSEPIVLGGDGSGDVFQMDDGDYAIDAAAMSFLYRTSPIDCDQPRQSKRFMGMKLLVEPTNAANLTVKVYADQLPAPGSEIASITSISTLAASDVRQDYVEVPVYFDIIAKYVVIDFVNTTSTEQIKIAGFTLYWMPEEDIL